MVHGNDNYTAEIGNQIIDLYSSGMNIVTICAQLNIPERTLYDYLTLSTAVEVFTNNPGLLALVIATMITAISVPILIIMDNRKRHAFYADQIQKRLDILRDLEHEINGRKFQIETLRRKANPFAAPYKN